MSCVLVQDWNRAIELILRPRVNEKPWVARARNHWWMYRHAGDALMCLGGGPDTHSIEGTLLRGTRTKFLSGSLEQRQDGIQLECS